MAYLATTTAPATTTPSSSSSANINTNSGSSSNNNISIHHHHNHQNSVGSSQQHHHLHHQQNHHQNNITSNNAGSTYHSGIPNHIIEERQDVIFRKVRGILNKITPETFDKLSKELVNVGLDSPRTLRGVIYLLFDKALKDLKYSSLYAKLCQELSEKAPNFEQEPGPNTFCKFLISKCEDEFERRRKATEDFDSKNELTDEEYEQKAIVKQKMLGNIKFICELGKKRLLQEEILHECIRGLLSKKKERPVQDQAQDLECLCQIMRTIGSLLDIQASRNLMNQYFERIDLFSKKPELPSRIRFMLRDVIDLRNNNWRPRPFQREDNVPQPLSKLREEAGYHDSSTNNTIDKFGNNRNLISLGGLSKLHGNKLSMLLDDEPSFTTTTDFHWGPSFLAMDQAFDAFSFPQSNTNNSGEAKRNQMSSVTSAGTHTAVTNANSSSSSSSTSAPAHQSQRPHHPFQHNDIFAKRETGDVGKFDVRKPLMNNADLNKPNIGENNRSYEGMAFEKTPFPNTRINSYNDRDFHISSRKKYESIYHCPVLPPRMQQQQLHQPLREPMNGISRRYGDPRQNHVPRAVGVVSPPVTHPVRRHIPPSGAMQPPPQSPKYQVHPNHRPDMRNNYGPNGGFHDAYDHRERRFHHRGDFPENGNRNSRFSNSNYRQVNRNDRPPHAMSREHSYFDKSNNQPESELNFNWRSGPPTKLGNSTAAAAAAAPPPHPPPGTTASVDISNTVSNLSTAPTIVANMQKPVVPRSNDHQIIESKIGDEKQLIKSSVIPTRQMINRYDEMDRKPEDLAYSEKRNTVDKISGPPNYLRDDRESSANSRNQPTNIANYHSVATRQSLMEPPININRFADARESHRTPHETHSSPARAPIRRPPHEVNLPPPPPHQQPQHQSQFQRQSPPPHLSQQNQNYRHSRSMHGEMSDNNRRDHRKFYPPHEHENQQHSRYPDNGISFPHQERNLRTAGRNPIFDNPHPTESDRVPSWRRAAPNVASSNNNNNVATKDQQLQQQQQQQQQLPHNSTPLLPKTPIKISDTANFSLRPSHNLVGSRNMAVTGLIQSNKSLSRVNSAASDIAQVKESQEQPEYIKANPSGRFQSETVQNLTTNTSNGSNDVDSGETKVGGSTNVSPSRTQAIEFHANKFMSTLYDCSSNEPSNVSRAASKVKEFKIPKNCQHECLVRAMKRSILRGESDRDFVAKLFVQLIPSIFEGPSLLNAFKVIFGQMKVLEVETPKVKSLVAGFLSQAISDGLLTLEEIGSVLTGGKHHPLFLLVLQKLEKSAGQAWLNEKFIASKINLMDMLPEIDRSKDRLASVLKDRGLGFLDPMLTTEPDLLEQMNERDPSPAAVYRWIKDNVDQTIQSTPTFAHVLISCLLKYIHNNAIEKSKSDSQKKENEPPQSPSTSDIERELLARYQQVLQAILKDKQMQLATLYSLQSFYHGLDFPKGALLRWFHMLYDMNIVDDDVFFIWKEEINDEFPGKGQALFQVNTWLNWLAEAESEEEEDV